MKELAFVLIAFAVVLGASVLAVETLGDRETFVPSPDAVAEQFARAVMAKRWEPAKAYLQDPESRSKQELEMLQRELGSQENVEAEIVARDARRAVVSVKVPKRNVIRNYSLVFGEEWKIE